jgi:hypothetical protein
MSRIWHRLRSALARFRKPATPPRQAITTAEAWDLWREASCDERAAHWWKQSKRLGRNDHATFTCGHCPATIDVYPADDEIRLPWGITVPVVTRTCKLCESEFRQIMTADSAPQEGCCKAHSNSVRQKRNRERTRPERMAAHEAQLHAAREAAQNHARLAACAEKDKLRYENERAAALAAGSNEVRHGSRTYPYECPCGYWHLTSQPPDAKQRAEALKRALFGEPGARVAM